LRTEKRQERPSAPSNLGRAMSPEQLRAPHGTRDILPPESGRWEALIGTFSDLARRADYGLVLTPLFEDRAVFSRGVGAGNDVVSKEMYELDDRGGRHLALRPEFTASLARAFVQHHPATPWRVWYWGPNFRYERPQAGRYRQFFQLGLEILGAQDPVADIEVVALASQLCEALGLRRVRLLVNSLGDGTCRPVYRELLTEFLADRSDALCPEHKERWRDNPLRVLDCKKPECVAVTAGAPASLDHLCEDCQVHWDAVVAGLDALGLRYEVNRRLVRGLDYYTRTTFELAADALEGSQNAVGGGGRYDGLVAALGGPETPGVGFSMGIDRLLLALDAEEAASSVSNVPDAFVIDMAGGSYGLVLVEELRRAGLRVGRGYDHRSLKAQMKMADRSGARVAVIIGDDEVAAGTATVRDLRGAGAVQESVERSQVVPTVVRLTAADRR
jgi:histidyl-tRNA synthetase